MKEIKDRFIKYKELKEERKCLEARIKEINIATDLIEDEVIPIMINEDMQNVSYPELGRVSLVYKKFPKIIDEERFYAYLYATDQSALIKTSVNSASLGAWYKEVKLSLNPEEIGLSVYEEMGIRLTKG